MRFHARPSLPSAVLKTRKTESNSGRLIRRMIKTPFYCPPLPGNDVTMLHEIASRLHTRAHTRSAFIRFVTPLRSTTPNPFLGQGNSKGERERERERLSTCRVGNARFHRSKVSRFTRKRCKGGLFYTNLAGIRKAYAIIRRAVYYVCARIPLPGGCVITVGVEFNERMIKGGCCDKEFF